MRRHWVLVTAAVLMLSGAQPRSEQRADSSSSSSSGAPALPVAVERPGFVCGATDPLTGLRFARTLAALPDNTPLAYEHFPRILRPNQTETIRVVAEVVGDVPVARFLRNVPSLVTGYTAEAWARATTRTVDGRLVSVFEQRYPGSVLADLLVYPHGHDFPQVPLGRFEVPGSGTTGPDGTQSGPTLVTIWLKLAASNLPASTVRVVTPTDAVAPAAQYASHVVNLVVPGFDDAQVLNGAQQFDLERAAHAFYQHFADTYHTLAFIPRRSPLASYTGFNINVMNDVAGIGVPLVDERTAYGSRMLRSVQLYASGFAGHHETVVHQIAHHWGDETNLAAIAGVTPAGHQPDSHTPLLSEDATLIGAVLEATREVGRVPPVTGGGADTYRIERTTTPPTFHPLQLYRMGFLQPAAVPDVVVFVDQGQFNATAATAPAVGVAVTGGRRTVSINEIMAALGPRSGPSFAEWRQAFVVVSDELISQAEMDYYNFYAQRAGASDGGTRAIDGYGSFFETSGDRVTLQTGIETLDPVANPVITQVLRVGYPAFGARDWRGLVFDAPVPSRLEAGAALTLTGQVDTQLLPGDVQFLILRASRYDAPPASATTVQTTVTGGRFSVPLGFTAAQTGAWAIDILVFADPDSPAITTSVVTPLFVD